MLPQVSS